VKRILSAVLGVAGLAAIVVLVMFFGLDDVRAALDVVGWGGVAILTIYRVLPVLVCAWAWQVLIRTGDRAGATVMIRARLARDAVAMFVPGGGEIAGARILTVEGVPTAAAAASTIADVTVETGGQAAFTILGFAAFAIALPDAGDGIGVSAIAGIALSLLLVAGLAVLQHPAVLSRIEKLCERLAGTAFSATWTGIKPALVLLYRDRTRLAGSFLIHLLAWFIGAAEAWVALLLMDRPLPIVSVLALESVVFAVRNVAFLVPWSVGIQEGSYIALGAAFGLAPDTALTLSLLKRVPELVLAIAGLAASHAAERRAFLSPAED
jgi:putative membrane protein